MLLDFPYPTGNLEMKTAKISVELIDSCGADLSVVNAARVSFYKESSYKWNEDEYEWEMEEKDIKLLNYLAKHKHLSPFNHAFLSFRVKAPIFVARQLVKHKFLPWNEVSRRYVDEEPEFYMPETWRSKSESKKQGSKDEPVPMSHACSISANTVVTSVLTLYKALLAEGVAPEQARMVLPQNTMTEWIWSGTLGAFCAMLSLRMKEDTQQETREVAYKIAEIVSDIFPHSYAALTD